MYIKKDIAALNFNDLETINSVWKLQPSKTFAKANLLFSAFIYLILVGGIMARINIEDELFRDPRWLDLLIKCGDRFKAIGLLTSAWIAAQQHWLDHGFVPEKAWSKELNILIEVELAQRVEGGVYVKGSKKSFKWLEQKQSAGKRGGRPKANTVDLEKAGESVRLSEQSGSKPLTLTPTLSLPLTLTQKLNTISKAVVKTTTLPKVKAEPKLFEPRSENELLENIPETTKQRWSRLFEDQDFIKRETIKAFGWAENNSKRKPKTAKGWIQFLSSWYDRAWPNYQKGIQSNKPKFDINEAQKLIAARKLAK